MLNTCTAASCAHTNAESICPVPSQAQGESIYTIYTISLSISICSVFCLNHMLKRQHVRNVFFFFFSGFVCLYLKICIEMTLQQSKRARMADFQFAFLCSLCRRIQKICSRRNRKENNLPELMIIAF